MTQEDFKKECIADLLGYLTTEEAVTLHNELCDSTDYPELKVYPNDAVNLCENVLPIGTNAYDALLAATYGCWIEGDAYAYAERSSGNLALRSFSYVTDSNSPINCCKVADWIVDEDAYEALDEYLCDERLQLVIEDYFRQYGEELGFTPLAIGIAIGRKGAQGGLRLEEDWELILNAD